MGFAPQRALAIELCMKPKGINHNGFTLKSIVIKAKLETFLSMIVKLGDTYR